MDVRHDGHISRNLARDFLRGGLGAENLGLDFTTM
jgi:hypothetical protein